MTKMICLPVTCGVADEECWKVEAFLYADSVSLVEDSRNRAWEGHSKITRKDGSIVAGVALPAREVMALLFPEPEETDPATLTPELLPARFVALVEDIAAFAEGIKDAQPETAEMLAGFLLGQHVDDAELVRLVRHAMTTPARIALRDPDGRVFYAVEEHQCCGVSGDSKPMAHVRGVWYEAVAEADVVEIGRSDRWVIDCWRLPPGMTIEGADAEITAEAALEAPTFDDDLYESVGHDEPVAPIRVLAAEWTWLEGEPPSNDNRVRLWRADLPGFLSHGQEYSHVFPGVLTCFIEAMAEVVGGLLHRRARIETGKIKGYVDYRYSPALYDKGHQRERSATKTTYFSCPAEIRGENLADALGNWDEARAALEEDVRRQSTVRTCGHCLGQGVIVGDEE